MSTEKTNPKRSKTSRKSKNTNDVIELDTKTKGKKDKLAAGLLAILVGNFGIHKFYLDQPVLGVVYIIFSCTGIPAIIGLVEGIIYLTMDDADFTEKYG